MIEWTKTHESATALWARTPLVVMRVTGDQDGYEAQIWSSLGDELAARADFEMMYDAQRWCLETYARLLSDEMARL